MINRIKKTVFLSTLFLTGFSCALQAGPPAVNIKQVKYACIPCGNDCDNEVYDKPGTCRVCHMVLVDKSTISIKNIQPADICDYIKKHPATILLDVRSKEEFDGSAKPNFGTLKNAINIPLPELSSRIKILNGLKQKEYIVFCSHSHRSPQAVYLLMQNGFSHVMNMAGGMSVMTDNSCRQ